jgi:hypothetical protein
VGSDQVAIYSTCRQWRQQAGSWAGSQPGGRPGVGRVVLGGGVKGRFSILSLNIGSFRFRSKNYVI